MSTSSLCECQVYVVSTISSKCLLMSPLSLCNYIVPHRFKYLPISNHSERLELYSEWIKFSLYCVTGLFESIQTKVGGPCRLPSVCVCRLTGCWSVLTASGVSSAADWWQSGCICANRETPSTQTDTHRLLLGNPRLPSLCVWKKEFLSVCVGLFVFLFHCFYILTLLHWQKSSAALIHLHLIQKSFILSCSTNVLLKLFPLKSFCTTNLATGFSY